MKRNSDRIIPSPDEALREYYSAESNSHSRPWPQSLTVKAGRPRLSDTRLGALFDQAVAAATLVLAAVCLSFGQSSASLGARISSSPVLGRLIDHTPELIDKYWHYLKF